MSNADETEDVESIRERKREELRQRAGAAPGGDGRTDAATGGAVPTSPVHVSGADHLDELVREHDVVLVDFYADWCGPCKMLEPVVEEIAAETPAVVAKVDVDAHQALAGQYQVQGVPTLYLFADGEAVERLVGAQDGATLEQLVSQYA